MMKMVVMPIAAYGALHLVVKNELILGVTTVALCMPVAVNATVISCQQGADEKLASSGTFISTALSVITIPAVISLLFG